MKQMKRKQERISRPADYVAQLCVACANHIPPRRNRKACKAGKYQCVDRESCLEFIPRDVTEGAQPLLGNKIPLSTGEGAGGEG